MRERSSGILMHISSLPGKYGIGDFGQSAYDFVDFLNQAKQKVWQILPIGITGYGDSPYQSFSAFAINPYFIDLDALVAHGFLKREDILKADLGKNPEQVDYEKLYFNKMPLLKKAYEQAKVPWKDTLRAYFKSEIEWLEPFVLYMSIKAHHDNRSWLEWPKAYDAMHKPSVKAFEQANEDEIYFWVFTQYVASDQWMTLKQYANQKNISIVGDLPIYVAEDSCDVWSMPQLFKLDDTYKPITVAGCPPDAFSATGQLWGNPIYDWTYMENHGFQWWVKRISHSLKQFDIVRIDHFRGFQDYWEIPYGDKTAVNGIWVKGPSMKLFHAIRAALGDVNIIAEDLGFMTDDVLKLREDSGFPGMKVLQFAFDSREESDYLPHNYDKNCIAYTGTHDNDTALGWMQLVAKDDRDYAIDYLQLNENEGYHWGLIRGAWASTAYLAIAQMQDFLGLDSKARMNTPSTLGNNWVWRAKKESLNSALAERMAKLTKTYRR